jgi:ABC-type multidrug transport system ATPase subunit
MDEPTNHLDIPSREALEDALDGFTGTMVLASHDRRLIARLATRLWLIEDGKLTDFNGTMEEYEQTLAAAAPAANTNAVHAKNPPPARPSRRVEERRQQLEASIHEREQAVLDLGEQINDASAAGEHQRIGELGERFESLQREIEELLEEWSAIE